VHLVFAKVVFNVDVGCFDGISDDVVMVSYHKMAIMKKDTN
jgi:hypothetical protein